MSANQTVSIKFNQLNSVFLNQAERTFPWIYRVPELKFEANRSMGSRVLIEQTNKQRSQLYIY